MFCKNCGNQLQNGMRFCSNCGCDNGAISDPNVQPAQYQASQSPQKNKKTGIIVGAVVGGLIIIILLAILIGGNKKPSNSNENNTSVNNNVLATPGDDTNTQENVWKPAAYLSSDYQSGQVQIDGVVYGDLPIKGSDFIKQGWQLTSKSYADKLIEPNNYSQVGLSNGTTEITARFMNYTDEPASLDNCYIVSLFNSDWPGTPIGTIVLPGGLTLNTSSYENVIEKWGQPEYDYVGKGESNFLNYYIGNYDEIYKYELEFDNNNILTKFTLMNYNKPSYIAPQQSAGSNKDTNASYNENTFLDNNETPNNSADTTDYINVSALDKIEANDTCPVKITGSEIVKDYYKGQLVNIGEVGNDACIFNISNNSGSTLNKVVFLAVAYNSNNNPMKIGGTITFFGDDKNVLQFTTKDNTIKAGDTSKVGVRCDGSSIYGTRSIVYSYTTADGVEHINNKAKEWYKNVYMD